jgi:hypothetical protein
MDAKEHQVGLFILHDFVTSTFVKDSYVAKEYMEKIYYLIKREVKIVGNTQRLATKEKTISVIVTILN